MIAGAIAIAVLPSLWAYHFFVARCSFLQRPAVRIVSSWALGQFSLVWISLAAAWVLSPFLLSLFCITTGALLFFALSALFLSSRRVCLVEQQESRAALLSFAVVTFAAFFTASALFLPHLKLIDGTIHRSKVFWDYIGVFGLPQTMALGNNFPPTSELMAGVPIAYHYFFFASVGLLGSICGGDAVFSLNVSSIFHFAALLLLIYGVGEQVFNSRSIGWLAVFFTLSSGTLHFFWRAYTHFVDGIIPLFTYSFLTKRRPDSLALTPDGSFGYNGGMFNLFYFVEERQLAGGCILVLLFSLALVYLRSMTSRERIILGSLLGLSLQWHLYSVLAISTAFVVGSGLTHSLRATIQVIAPTVFAAVIQMIWFSTQGGLDNYNPSLFARPTIDFTFATIPDLYPISLVGAIKYWIFAFGGKAFVFGSFLLFSSRFGIDRRTAAIWCLPVLCLFTLTNSVKLSPLSIYDNHKWTRPMMILIDLGVAAVIIGSWNNFRSIRSRSLAIIAVIACSLTGLLENVGYFRTQRMNQVVRTDSPLAEAIAASPPDSVYLSTHPLEILAQGRRLYVTTTKNLPGNPRFDQNYLSTARRDAVAARIWGASSLRVLCDLIKETRINFIAYAPDRQPRWPIHFAETCTSQALRTTNGEWVRLLSTSCSCQIR